MGAIAIAQYTIRDASDITVSAVAPSSPSVDELWLDTSQTPNQMKRWNGTSWDIVNDAADLIEAIEEAKTMVDEIEIGSRNLLSGTSEEEITTTEDVIYEKINFARYDSDYAAFRVHLNEVSGEWQAAIRVYPTSAQTPLLGTMKLGENILGASNNSYMEVPAEVDKYGWATAVAKLPLHDVFVQAVITHEGTGELKYHSPQLEAGKIPSHWIKSQEDVDEKINEVDGRVAQAMETITTYGTQVTQLEGSYNVLAQAVTQDAEKLHTLNVRQGNLEITSEKISQSVSDLKEGLKTNFDVTAEYVVIRQSQDPGYEQRLYASSMEFVNTETNEAVASFGIDGAVIDQVKSKKMLNVGTDEYGWYEIAVLKNGVADKWRDGTDTVPKLLIIKDPENAYGANGDTVSFSFEAENIKVSSSDDKKMCTWRYRSVGNNTEGSAITSSKGNTTYEVTVSATSLNREYSCRITGEDGTIYNTPFVRIFNTNAPQILIDLPSTATVGTTLKTYAPGATTYQWYKMATTSWSSISGATSNTYTPNEASKYQCRAWVSSTNPAMTSICIVS